MPTGDVPSADDGARAPDGASLGNNGPDGASTEIPSEPPAAPLIFAAHEALLSVAPLVVLALLAPVLLRVLGPSWAALDDEARRERDLRPHPAKPNSRVLVVFLVGGASLTWQTYFAGAHTYEDVIRHLVRAAAVRLPWLRPHLFDELYGFAWWSFARAVGYVVIPVAIWKTVYPRDDLRAFGLGPVRLRAHGPAYLLCLAAVAPLVVFAARRPDFLGYYPFYSQCTRSVLDLALWETIYLAQFLTLEWFFRGFWVGALRPSLGAAAVYSMCVPYCMIHYGKPYFEAQGALVAGLVLGTLAARTRSIFGGFFVHAAVALAMDALALSARGGFPRAWVPW